MISDYIEVKTKGTNHIINITPQVEGLAKKHGIDEGIIFLNVIGSTAALTTMEFEPGLEKDVQDFLDKIVPFRKDYAHNFTWNDDNGHSHLRSTLLKTNLFIPVTKGSLDLGTWQQVVLIECDTRPRDRKIAVKVLT